jgi:hypothetical protein
MYALCLALGVPPEIALAHLTSIRKKDVTVNAVGVMHTSGGISFEAQVKDMYAQRDASGGTSSILEFLGREHYCVNPEWGVKMV